MAFQTGHTPPTGFVAGQLRDGSSVGTFQFPAYGQYGTATVEVFTRYYKNTLVVEVQMSKADGTIIPGENRKIKQAAYLGQLYSACTGQPTILKDLSTMAASAAQLVAIGLVDNGNVLISPTSDLIPYELTADGKIQSFVSPVDAAKAAAAQQTSLVTSISKLAQGVTGTPSTASSVNGSTGTTTTDTTTSTNPAWVKYVVYGVIGVVIIVAGMAIAKSFKKKGQKKNKN